MSYPRRWGYGIGEVHRLSADDWNYHVDYSHRKGCSFHLEYEAPDYLAVDGKYGRITYGGPHDTGGVDGGDPSAVLQAAIDGLTPGRTRIETILIKGDFGQVHDITTPSYTRFVGEGALLTLPSPQLYLFKQPATDIHNVEFEGIDFAGYSKTAGYAIYHYYFDGAYRYAYDVKVKNCSFTNLLTSHYLIGERTWFNGNTVTASGYGFMTVWGRQNHIEYNTIIVGDPLSAENCRGGYILDVEDMIVADNFFTGLTGVGGTNYWGLRLEAYARKVNIHDNHFTDMTLHGIVLGADDRAPDVIDIINIHDNTFRNTPIAVNIGEITPCTRIRVADNIARNVTTLVSVGTNGTDVANTVIRVKRNQVETTTTGFLLYGNAYDVAVEDNDFEGLAGTPVIQTGVLRLRNNTGFLSENSDVSTGTGLQQSIDHGLILPPTRVYFSNIEDAANPYQSAAADADHIFVTAVNGKDYVWRAEIV